MAYANTLYRIIDKLINTLRLNGFKSITYGTEKDIDFSKKDITYPLGYRDWETDRKSTRLNSSHSAKSRMPSSA